ncbi:MAG: cache domain-containing protein [Rhodospirillaceae bacterium]|nr:cache domain-containing protein [Rhodospirillaceae bacterium]
MKARTLAAAILLGCLAIPAVAAERGTAEEAQALVARAIALYQAEGEAAFAAMTVPSTEFVDRDLYIFVIGPDNRVVAHGFSLERIGLDVTTMIDDAANPYGVALIEDATAEGAWVDYRREDPLTGLVEEKSSWVVGYDGYVFGSGIYRP